MESRELHREKALKIFRKDSSPVLGAWYEEITGSWGKKHWKRTGRATLEVHTGPKVEFFPLARV